MALRRLWGAQSRLKKTEARSSLNPEPAGQARFENLRELTVMVLSGAGCEPPATNREGFSGR